MKAEDLVRAGMLWDQGRVIQEALEWIRGRGAFFAGMKISQVEALQRTVQETKGRGGFCRGLKLYLSGAVKRDKREQYWTADRARELRKGVLTALKAATAPGSKERKAFDQCQRAVKSGPKAARLKFARDEAVLRAYMAALGKARRAQDALKEFGKKEQA